MVEEQALTLVQCADSVHFSIAQGKIEYIQVLLHPLLVSGFGNHHHIGLDEEPQDSLGGCFAVILADLHQHGVGKAALFALCKGPPRLRAVRRTFSYIHVQLFAAGIHGSPPG